MKNIDTAEGLVQLLRDEHIDWFVFLISSNEEILKRDFRSAFFYYSVCFFQEVEEFYASRRSVSEAGDVLAFAVLILHMAEKQGFTPLKEEYNLTIDDCLRFYRGDNDTKFINRILSAVWFQCSLMSDGLIEAAIAHNHKKLKERVAKYGSLKKDK